MVGCLHRMHRPWVPSLGPQKPWWRSPVIPALCWKQEDWKFSYLWQGQPITKNKFRKFNPQESSLCVCVIPSLSIGDST